MAPEIFLNQVTIEHRTKLDVYSFGIIMYEMFFEEVPYSQNFEQYDSIITLGNRIAGGLRPQMPEHLIQNLTGAERRYLGLMERCWSKKPEDRPSFDEIYSEFAKIEQ
jgi:mitogen-activated protein kinase kinase kinase 7